MDDAVGLGGRGQVPRFATARELERVAQDAVDTLTGKNTFLYRHLELSVAVKPSADLRVFPFVIFAHHIEINVVFATPAQRRSDSLEQPYGTQVDVLVHFPTNRYQQAPQRHMVWYPRKSDCAEKDRVVLFELFYPVLRHHAPGFGIGLTAPVEALPFETDLKASACFLQCPHALGHNLFANAIPWDSRDLVCVHGQSLCSTWKVCEFNAAPSVAPLTGVRVGRRDLPLAASR